MTSRVNQGSPARKTILTEQLRRLAKGAKLRLATTVTLRQVRDGQRWSTGVAPVATLPHVLDLLRQPQGQIPRHIAHLSTLQNVKYRARSHFPSGFTSKV